MRLEHELVYLPALRHDLPLGLGEEVKPPVYDSVDLLYHQCGSMWLRQWWDGFERGGDTAVGTNEMGERGIARSVRLEFAGTVIVPRPWCRYYLLQSKKGL